MPTSNIPGQTKAEQTLKEAKQALVKGLREHARALALRSVELDSQLEESWLILAALAGPEESIKYLRRALQINPGSVLAQKGMRWALERINGAIASSQTAVVEPKTVPLNQTQPLSIPSFPVRQLHPAEIGDEEFWQIDIARIITPHKNVYEFIVNGFFTAQHQISITDNMGELHSHTFRLQVMAAAMMVTHENQVLVSYDSIASIVNRICKAYEAKILNDLPPFADLQPTTENLVGVITQQLERLSAGMQFTIAEVTLMESPTVGVIYKNSNTYSVAPPTNPFPSWRKPR